MSKTELYEAISSRKGNGVRIRQELCFYNPKEVYRGLTSNSSIIKWLKFISNHYLPPPDKKVLLIYPCSTEKPYHKSRSYRSLFKTLQKLGNERQKIHVVTISEPFGLVPEEFYDEENPWHNWKNEWYDCPGLFEWWCKKYNQSYSEDDLDRCIEILASYVANFLIKVKKYNSYSKIIAFVRTYSSKLEIKKDHTHRRILEMASKISNVEIDVLPPRELVANIVMNNGRLAWDMQGIAHPMAQNFLLNYLKEVC